MMNLQFGRKCVSISILPQDKVAVMMQNDGRDIIRYHKSTVYFDSTWGS